MPYAKNNQDPIPGSPMLGLSVGPTLLLSTFIRQGVQRHLIYCSPSSPHPVLPASSRILQSILTASYTSSVISYTAVHPHRILYFQRHLIYCSPSSPHPMLPASSHIPQSIFTASYTSNIISYTAVHPHRILCFQRHLIYCSPSSPHPILPMLSHPLQSILYHRCNRCRCSPLFHIFYF
ncbi:hypothetical protein PoB_001687100 [Plakobranchus ocellatus]|uniref:Uncharacterized protein n=1 Tax=Plakobranchus ocellatus TaxID=259542 RepID=A0AAV3YTC3_9GAST|nr:hypothetical protein PoB_001687100 [Plakobranchus ocellatus]